MNEMRRFAEEIEAICESLENNPNVQMTSPIDILPRIAEAARLAAKASAAEPPVSLPAGYADTELEPLHVKIAGLVTPTGEIGSDRDGPSESAAKRAEHWIGPFDWPGGECPVPNKTQVRLFHRSMLPQNSRSDYHWWDHRGRGGDIVSFSYLADNPEGWLPRPAGWVPPASSWPLEVEWRNFGKSKTWQSTPPVFCGAWDGAVKALRFRLLPREPRAERPELPAGWEMHRGWLLGPSCVVPGNNIPELRSIAAACLARAAQLEENDDGQ